MKLDNHIFYTNNIAPVSPFALSFKYLTKARDLPISIILQLKKIKKSIKEQAEIFNETLNDLLEVFGTKGESGMLMIEDLDPKYPEFSKKHMELCDVEFEIDSNELVYDNKVHTVVGLSLDDMEILDKILDISSLSE